MQSVVAVRQDDRAPPRIEDGDGVNQDRVHQIDFALMVNKAMGCTKQGEQIFARPGAAIAMKGEFIMSCRERLRSNRFSRHLAPERNLMDYFNEPRWGAIYLTSASRTESTLFALTAKQRHHIRANFNW